jgi:hypothetical protein
MEQARAMSEGDSAAARMMAVLGAVEKTFATFHYPINSFDELVREAARTKISVGKIVIDLPALRGLVPAYYFPIANKANLLEKITELSKSAGAALIKNQFGKLSITQEIVFPARSHPLRNTVASEVRLPDPLADR